MITINSYINNASLGVDDYEHWVDSDAAQILLNPQRITRTTIRLELGAANDCDIW